MQPPRTVPDAAWTVIGAASGLATVGLVYAAAMARAGTFAPWFVVELHQRTPALLVLDTVPAVLGLVGLLLSRTRRAERELAAAQESVGPWSDAGLQEVLLEAALVVDASGTVVAANRAAALLFGHADEPVGVRLDALLPDLASATSIDRNDPEGRPLGVEWHTVALRAGGERLRVEVASAVAPGRRLVYVVRRAVVARHLDPAERDRLVRERDEAVAANRTRGAFYANLSHELRTPLSAIIGYAELLSEELADRGIVLDAEIEAIRKGARHLLSLVNGVLDLSKIEAGRLSVVLEPVPVAPILREVEVTAVPLARANGNVLLVRIEPGVHAVRGDETRLRQVLINLVGNACKFTKDGTVSVTVGYDHATSNVTFDVADTGIGMTGEQVGRLFQEYMQADAKIQRRFGGTGLGLALSRRLVELMGGTISVKSELGKGSTFTVRLPFGSTQHTLLPDLLSGESYDLGTPPLVMIDRHPGAVRDRLYKALVAAGLVEVLWPSEVGPQALAAKRPRAIVLDCDPTDVLIAELPQAPELDGVPIVVMTDDEPSDDPFEPVGWLQRPLDPALLLPLLRQGDRRVSGAAVVGSDPDVAEVARALSARGWRAETFPSTGLARPELARRRFAVEIVVADEDPRATRDPSLWVTVLWVSRGERPGAIPLVESPEALADLIELALYRAEPRPPA